MGDLERAARPRPFGTSYRSDTAYMILKLEEWMDSESREDRAEKRALMELEMKSQTLALEQEKFLLTKARLYRDRFGAGIMRGSSSLLIANGTAIIFCLNSYKTLSENLSKGIASLVIGIFCVGFITAIISFMCAISVYVGHHDDFKKPPRGDDVTYWVFGGFAILSIACLIGALILAYKTLIDQSR